MGEKEHKIGSKKRQKHKKSKRKNFHRIEKTLENTGLSRVKLSMGYEKDGFAFLIDGFEPSKPFSSREKGFPPRLMTVAIRRGGKCGGGMKQSQELSNFKSSDEDYFDSIFGFDNHALKYLSHDLIVIADRVIY